MSFRAITSLVLVASVVIAASIRAGQTDDAAAIAGLIEQVESANNAGNVEAWVNLFAADFVYMAPGAPPVTARDQLVEVAKTGFRNSASIDIQPVEIKVSGDWAFATTRVTGSVKLHTSGNVVKVDTKQLVIYRRDERGVWRVARMMSNSNS